MKRFVVLFLLSVLPLQITWAAGVAHCPHDGSEGASASARADTSGAAGAHAHDRHGADEGHAASSGLDCSVFHFVALEPSAPRAPLLSQAGAAADDVENPAYKSRPPDGLDRPKWRLAG